MQAKLLAYGGALAGVGLIASSFSQVKKKNEVKITIPSSIEPLLEFVSEDVLISISKDSTWTELCDRASEFVVLYKDEMVDFLYAVADVV